ncbi:MAG: alkaline phosphatase family protein [Verrucomicrobiales bacterium]|nr:alkaline phosphatase family protein [Verrucomicrobiales bacterium]
MRSSSFLAFCLLCCLISSPESLRAEAPRVGHVVVVSFDGGKPAVIEESEMPVLKKLAAEGAVTWTANTILPPKTLPSHTSMLTGLDVSHHGVIWNDWQPLRGVVKVPTLFSLAKATGKSTALFAGKVKFRHLWLPDSLDAFGLDNVYDEAHLPSGDEKQLVPSQAVAGLAATYLAEHKPALCFVHFPDPDSAGHKSGWGSPEQKEAFKVSDQALGQIVKAIEKGGFSDDCVIIVSADHGGTGKNHSQDTPSDRNIPWVAWGKGVKPGFAIAGPVMTYDTAATALWLLGVDRPATLDGHPVLEAFQN